MNINNFLDEIVNYAKYEPRATHIINIYTLIDFNPKT